MSGARARQEAARRYKPTSARAARSSANILGSDTAVAAVRKETESGTGMVSASSAALAEGSKTNVPPAPTVKLVPSGRASELVTYNVPALTVVPPV